MGKPKYSVIIPTYNHLDKFLKPCLESIIRHTDLNNTEVIVVANGCVDDTVVYVNDLSVKYPSIKLIESKEGLGYTKATNLGIKAAQGEYAILLNNDTVLLPQPTDCWLQQLELPFINDPKMGVTGPLWIIDKITKTRFVVFFCAMIPMRLFDELGLLDEVFSPGGGEDIDFCIKAQLKGYNLQVVPYDTNLQKSEESSKTVIGNFPIYHYAEGTFEDIESYGSLTFKRNSLINLKRYVKDIKLHLTSIYDRNVLPEFIKVHPIVKTSDIVCKWDELEFDDNSVIEIALANSIHEIPLALLNNYTDEWYRVLKSGGKVISLVPMLNTAVIVQTLISSGFKIDGTQKHNEHTMYVQASKL